jgi:hypothetical protein
MTPDEVAAMDEDTYHAFERFMRAELRARERAARKR